MTPGHRLWALLQDGKYVGVENGKPYDYWPDLPARRRAAYEQAAQALMEDGRLASSKGVMISFGSDLPSDRA
jgi:hypothetical protein